ncbi:MAG: hypothetical protein II114_05175 [Treponema sp.]|nr:hypothetical protein [Treponema sp.]MBQ4236752.1 hypothetical protein [Treponema sp.]MBQ5383560.1 hypothetical protein [Treponema sp.]
MKKILAFVAVAFIAVASTFAAGAQIEGTWNDAKWNANWTLGADTDGNFAVILTNAKTGKQIYKFTEKNIDGKFEWNVGMDGVSLSFTCKKTLRSYKFTKGVSLSTDLTLNIVPQWKQAEYEVSMPMVGNNLSAPEVKAPEVNVSTPSVSVSSDGVNASF